MSVRPQWNFASMGSTKYVQPYCRLAIITMQMMPAINWIQRLTGTVLSEAGLVDMPNRPFLGLRSRSLVQVLPARIQISHHDTQNLSDHGCIADRNRLIAGPPIPRGGRRQPPPPATNESGGFRRGNPLIE